MWCFRMLRGTGSLILNAFHSMLQDKSDVLNRTATLHQPSIWEEGEAFYDMQNKIVRRLLSWQRRDTNTHQQILIGVYF